MAAAVRFELPEHVDDDDLRPSRLLRLGRVVGIMLVGVVTVLHSVGLSVMCTPALPAKRQIELRHPWMPEPDQNLTEDVGHILSFLSSAYDTLQTVHLHRTDGATLGRGWVLHEPSHPPPPLPHLFPPNRTTGDASVDAEHASMFLPTFNELVLEGGYVGVTWSAYQLQCKAGPGPRDFVALYGSPTAANTDFLDYVPVSGAHLEHEGAGQFAGAHGEGGEGAARGSDRDDDDDDDDDGAGEWGHAMKANWRSFLWYGQASEWHRRLSFMDGGANAKLKIREAPKKGLWVMPRVHTYVQREPREDGECSVWRATWDTQHKRHFFTNTLTDAATWEVGETSFRARQALFTVVNALNLHDAATGEGGLLRGAWARLRPWKDPAPAADHKPKPAFEVRYWCTSPDGYTLGGRSMPIRILQPHELEWSNPVVTYAQRADTGTGQRAHPFTKGNNHTAGIGVDARPSNKHMHRIDTYYRYKRKETVQRSPIYRKVK